MSPRGVWLTLGLDTVFVALHVPAGIVAVISGAGAMLAEKGGRTHLRCGRIYLRALAVVSLSAVGLVVTRWPRFPHLLALAIVAGALAAVGYGTRRRRSPTEHLLCMAGSYVVLLTAFYVDNGPKLPLWNLLPPLTFWFLPSLVAAPFVFRALKRHSER